MPSLPSQCCTRNVVWNPMNVSQKCTLPSRSSSIRPVIFGNQKYTPPNTANTIVPKSTYWKCATTKYVSETCQSIGGLASSTPDRPPSRKVVMKPSAHSIGVSNVSCPRHMVPIQLKNLIPVGTAMRNVRNEKNGSSTWPVANMWCAHTVIDSAAMAIVAATMPLYPNSGLRLNTGMIRVMMPKNGSATM